MKRVFGLVGVVVLAIVCSTWAPRANAQDAAAPTAANLPPAELGNVAPEAWAAYCPWTATLPADQLAWEKMLQKHLGPAYFPGYLKDRLAGKITLDEPGVWGFVKDDPALPRVLLIGASISCQYTEEVRHLLKGKANVHRGPCNAGPTRAGVANMEDWVATPEGTHWDIIQFNFGFHDRLKSSELYAGNLEKIIAKLQKTGAILVWARTEPFDQRAEEGIYMFNAKETLAKLNNTADAVMAKHPEIKINDMHGVMADKYETMLGPDRIHYKEAGNKLLAEHVAKVMSDIIAEQKTAGGTAGTNVILKAK